MLQIAGDEGRRGADRVLKYVGIDAPMVVDVCRAIDPEDKAFGDAGVEGTHERSPLPRAYLPIDTAPVVAGTELAGTVGPADVFRQAASCDGIADWPESGDWNGRQLCGLWEDDKLDSARIERLLNLVEPEDIAAAKVRRSESVVAPACSLQVKREVGALVTAEPQCFADLQTAVKGLADLSRTAAREFEAGRHNLPKP